jgi:hypothetical protein
MEPDGMTIRKAALNEESSLITYFLMTESPYDKRSISVRFAKKY